MACYEHTREQACECVGHARWKSSTDARVLVTCVFMVKMARLSLERGYTVLQIQRQLYEERTAVSCQALYNLLRKFREKNTIENLPGRRRQRKIIAEMKTTIEPNNQSNLKGNGWVCTRPHYCQLLQPVSKACCVKYNRKVTCLSARVTSNYCLPLYTRLYTCT